MSQIKKIKFFFGKKPKSGFLPEIFFRKKLSPTLHPHIQCSHKPLVVSSSFLSAVRLPVQIPWRFASTFLIPPPHIRCSSKSLGGSHPPLIFPSPQIRCSSKSLGVSHPPLPSISKFFFLEKKRFVSDKKNKKNFGKNQKIGFIPKKIFDFSSTFRMHIVDVRPKLSAVRIHLWHLSHAHSRRSSASTSKDLIFF